MEKRANPCFYAVILAFPTETRLVLCRVVPFSHIYPNKKSKAASDAIETTRRIFRIIWASYSNYRKSSSLHRRNLQLAAALVLSRVR
jgi:hypothetical protein